VNESTARIRIDAAGGNDIVAVAMNVPLKASLSGGWGADKITSGKRRSILYGGGGSDRLFSRSLGGATLDGGKGADRYYNRFGEVKILGRDDGDALMVNGSAVDVNQSGFFGILPSTGSADSVSSSSSGPRFYFFADGDESRTNLLA
jgi:Ca2+-binding RTX toxin-like protein